MLSAGMFVKFYISRMKRLFSGYAFYDELG
jgi:hypothetical protein